MELKPYQQQVINDITSFLQNIQESRDTREAFYNFWSNHPRTPLFPYSGTAVEPYKNNVPKVPHVCIKVPTAGGKTFIACNAIKTIFDAFPADRVKAVVWLVPSITILEQTIRNLRDPNHAYRQKINAHFGNKIAVFDKAALLQGNGFDVSSVNEQLSIMVFTFDSFRTKLKEGKKVFQENGNLQSFEQVMDRNTEINLGAVIEYLNPLVIVDESHNAESELSVEMLKTINPCFILDLTATPRRNSNIISFIDALELKKENMVKLPVIVHNHQDKTEVINSSLQLQKRLELQAIAEEKKGGRYIRPIVLFQVQPKSGKAFLTDEEEKSNVQKLKEKLIELKIPASQIKIKTAGINELQHIDLMRKDCEVRFIITINALKEGWDCPFAYILASLADKSSAVDVEQILGRVLRQPYVSQHDFYLLNMSYVLTASSRFLETLENIVKGLNKAGFSEQDFKLADPDVIKEINQPAEQLVTFDHSTARVTDDITEGIDLDRITLPSADAAPVEAVMDIEKMAAQQNEDFELMIEDMNRKELPFFPTDIKSMLKSYPIKAIFQEVAAAISIPQFYLKVPGSTLFNITEQEMLFEKENLMEGFKLSQQSTDIAFHDGSAQLYKVDLDETKKEHTPTFVRLDGKVKQEILDFMMDPANRGKRVQHFVRITMSIIGNLYPISDKEIEKYLSRIFEYFSDDQFNDFLNHQYSYTDKIKDKIRELTETFSEQKFREYLNSDRIFIRESYALPQYISPLVTGKNINRSLYEKEGQMNPFEERIIDELASLSNVLFWTRNTDRKGFRINGFINHYPDFIVMTESGKLLLIETKGDHLDGSDSEKKVRLGQLWSGAAGSSKYKYFMVYENKGAAGAIRIDELLRTVREM